MPKEQERPSWADLVHDPPCASFREHLWRLGQDGKGSMTPDGIADTVDSHAYERIVAEVKGGS